MSIFDEERTKLSQRNQLELLCFRLTGYDNMFAVNVFKVRETVKFKELILLPDAHDCIQGLLTLRKEIIPIVDLEKWISYEIPSHAHDAEKYPDSKKQIIVCEFNDNIIGIKVLNAEYILRRNWEDISVPISNEFGSKINNYTKTDNLEIVYIVDVESMLAEIFSSIGVEKDYETQSLQPIALKDPNKFVLIADDSQIAIKSLTSVLERLRVQYKTFSNGKELLDFVGSAKDISDIGMIITDLEMPVVSGFTVIKKIKENNALSHIPIIVNSSMTGGSNVEMAKNLNAQGFVGKTRPTEISNYVKKFLG